MLLSIFIITITINGQVLLKPVYAAKNPETLELLRIEMTPESTRLFLSVENRITGGYFCTDRRTYLYLPDNKRLRLIKAEGITYCPELYKFYTTGEKLLFDLTFPAIPEGTKWFDLVEQCGGNCYWMYGITFDNELNKSIDEAFAMIERKESEKALDAIIIITDNIDNKNYGVEGLLYVTIIKLLNEMGKDTEATEWYRKMKTSEAPHLQLFIKYLEDMGIKY
ncbi:MAG: hypothetical protein ACUVTX_06955 [Bacteroidales bacterium]